MEPKEQKMPFGSLNTPPNYTKYPFCVVDIVFKTWYNRLTFPNKGAAK